jgi:hypothetical protein
MASKSGSTKAELAAAGAATDVLVVVEVEDLASPTATARFVRIWQSSSTWQHAHRGRR